MRRVTAATVGAVAVASMLAVAADARAAVTVPLAARRHTPSVVFNIPSGSAEQQNAIGSPVNALAAAVPRGGRIRIAVYRLTAPTFAQTLLDARKLGVRV